MVWMNKLENGNFEYKGKEIEPFRNLEGKVTPRHIIKQYYESEQASIDRQIAWEEKRKNNPEKYENLQSVDEALEEFLKEFYPDEPDYAAEKINNQSIPNNLKEQTQNDTRDVVMIIYNYKGIKEENYLYLKEDLQRRMPNDEFTKLVENGKDEWQVNYFSPNKSYMAKIAKDEEELKAFVNGKFNEQDTEVESEDWYWENRKDDLFCISNDLPNLIEMYSIHDKAKEDLTKQCADIFKEKLGKPQNKEGMNKGKEHKKISDRER